MWTRTGWIVVRVVLEYSLWSEYTGDRTRLEPRFGPERRIGRQEQCTDLEGVDAEQKEKREAVEALRKWRNCRTDNAASLMATDQAFALTRPPLSPSHHRHSRPATPPVLHPSVPFRGHSLLDPKSLAAGPPPSRHKAVPLPGIPPLSTIDPRTKLSRTATSVRRRWTLSSITRPRCLKEPLAQLNDPPQDDQAPASSLAHLYLQPSHPGRKDLLHVHSAGTTSPAAITPSSVHLSRLLFLGVLAMPSVITGRHGRPPLEPLKLDQYVLQQAMLGRTKKAGGEERLRSRVLIDAYRRCFPHCPWTLFPTPTRSRPQPRPLLGFSFGPRPSRLNPRTAVVLHIGPPPDPTRTPISPRTLAPTHPDAPLCLSPWAAINDIRSPTGGSTKPAYLGLEEPPSGAPNYARVVGRTGEGLSSLLMAAYTVSKEVLDGIYIYSQKSVPLEPLDVVLRYPCAFTLPERRYVHLTMGGSYLSLAYVLGMHIMVSAEEELTFPSVLKVLVAAAQTPHSKLQDSYQVLYGLWLLGNIFALRMLLLLRKIEDPGTRAVVSSIAFQTTPEDKDDKSTVNELDSPTASGGNHREDGSTSVLVIEEEPGEKATHNPTSLA
ncbi:hypothetical protein NMY22_g10048 [Coprinellus aureogranulatus]|nr:hypothetical protein NMY22_g10048 [Coprinellus aureogranulatus]